jgi:hypothetical protein
VRKSKPASTNRTNKPDLAHRLSQVRTMVQRAERERERLEEAGLTQLAREKAREKRYWQFVEAVLELRPTMGQTLQRHIIH